MSSYFHKMLYISTGAVAVYAGSKFHLYKNENKHSMLTKDLNSVSEIPLLSRNEQIKALQTATDYDILVIGGGATGSGIALDSVSRGLKTALVEQDDFSSGTSSRSTKLIHGGVRYLQRAIMHFDIEQYRMVKEALQERANVLAVAPHLSYPLPIMLPIHKWWQVPYFWIGLKMYDLVAGRQLLKSSYFLSHAKASELFPLLNKDKLCGAIVYYDGMHNDARMNLSIIMTAARMGANVANHVAVINLLKSINSDGKVKVCGARVKDMLTGAEWNIHAKVVINATGPFTDSIRKMDNAKCISMCQPSAGVHIVLPKYYSPENMGLLDPSTSDGRVLFFLPWQNMTIAGTTDRPCKLTHHPSPTENEIQFLLKEIKKYLSPEITIRRGDVLSAWSGIRPLVSDPHKSSTEEITRRHVLHVSDSDLITIVGGKWTTYRKMAEEAVDAAVKICNLQSKSRCQTKGLLLEGAREWTPNLYIRLVKDYGFDYEVAQHLANTYGDQAFAVAEYASVTGKKWPIVGRRLHEQFPYIEAEVHYAVTSEYACTAIDVIARRLRLSFLNVEAAEDVLPAVITLMADHLNWSLSNQYEEYEKAMEFLRIEMGGNAIEPKVHTYNLSKEELDLFIQKFQSVDKDKRGYVTLNDLKKHLIGKDIDDKTLDRFLNGMKLSKDGHVALEEYLRLMNAMKDNSVTT